MKKNCNRCKLRTSWGGGCEINIRVSQKRSSSGVIIDQKPLEDCPKPTTKVDAYFYLGQDETTYVYCLYKNNSKKPFYVGITKNIKTRLRDHKKEKGFKYALYIEVRSRKDAVMIEDAIINLLPLLENKITPYNEAIKIDVKEV